MGGINSTGIQVHEEVKDITFTIHIYIKKKYDFLISLMMRN